MSEMSGETMTAEDWIMRGCPGMLVLEHDGIAHSLRKIGPFRYEVSADELRTVMLRTLLEALVYIGVDGETPGVCR
jgi:hypothetical protein